MKFSVGVEQAYRNTYKHLGTHIYIYTIMNNYLYQKILFLRGNAKLGIHVVLKNFFFILFRPLL